MAVLCRSINLLFLANPRTGSMAVRKALISSGLGEQIPAPGQARKGLRPHHTTLPALKKSGLLSESQYEGLVIVTGVRNPFDSVASHYQKFLNWAAEGRRPGWLSAEARAILDDCEQRPVEFDEFVERRYSQVKGPTPNLRWTGWADRYYRFENMIHDFRQILEELGADPMPALPSYHLTGGRRPYRDYYSDTSRATIERVFREDLQAFGYGF
jgi:hypothetical protein